MTKPKKTRRPTPTPDPAPDFFEAVYRETGARLTDTPAFLEAYRRVTGSDDVSPRAINEAMGGTGARAAKIFRVWAEIKKQREHDELVRRRGGELH
jgi:hypothetical protein